MSARVVTGLEVLLKEKSWQDKVKGHIGYLAHSASIDHQYELGIIGLKRLFGDRLKKLFGPQHGLFATVQDNMIETPDFHEAYFDLQVYSLYSKTRSPTLEMLEGLDTLIIDLQDVGTRIYTYIYTMTLFMEAISKLRPNLQIMVLDRPNPLGGEVVEGNILDLKFQSFVGRHTLPVRHGMTIGEVALWAQRNLSIPVSLQVVPMLNWKREMNFFETQLPWVNPSPNLPTVEGAYTFPGTVLFEGTSLSEGRGTTRALEMVGHPELKPFAFKDALMSHLKNEKGFILRPMYFWPTFQKHAGKACGGIFIHPTDYKEFRPWKLGQILMRELAHHLGVGKNFAWKEPPYEYEYHLKPIDLINGTDELRDWVERRGSLEDLERMELRGRSAYLEQKAAVHLY